MGPYGVTVNAIAPGAIASRQGPASLATWLGHPGKCEDIAALALFIASALLRPRALRAEAAV